LAKLRLTQMTIFFGQKGEEVVIKLLVTKLKCNT
jgi:hypothetical protein